MNSFITTTQLIDSLKWRYATKQFDATRKISNTDWTVLEDSIVLTPTSFGLQPFTGVVVDNSALREQLVPHSWNQRQVADASHLIVFSVKTTYTEEDANNFIKLVANTRGITTESLEGYRGMIVNSVVKGMDDSARRLWATKQAYIALGQFMLAAAGLGIDVCPIEGFMPDKYDSILNLSSKGLASVVVAAAGYRAETDNYAKLAKVRLPKDKVIVHI